MKPHTYLLSLFVLVAGLFQPLMGAEPDTASIEKQDDLANFVLEKAKLYTDKGEAALALAVDVVMREAPGLVEEFLRWRWWSNAVVLPALLLAAAAFLVPGVWGLWRCAAIEKERGPAYFAGKELLPCIVGILGSVFTFILTFVAIFHGGECAMQCVKISIAPRVYLLENLVSLLK